MPLPWFRRRKPDVEARPERAGEASQHVDVRPAEAPAERRPDGGTDSTTPAASTAAKRRRGTRGGRNRKKKTAAASSANGASASEPAAEATAPAEKRTVSTVAPQALFLMNEPQCFESARHFAEKALKEGGASPEERAAWMLRRAVLRVPTPQDVADLVAVYTAQRAVYEKDPESAKKTISFGDLPPDASVPAPELAAWTLTANVILNLDEFLNKR